jgi:murein DD-endopeptidase MepM/ murein hydrolase activator NlpD
MFGASRTTDNPLGCDPGRNAGRPQPPWYPQVRLLLERNLDFFPSNIDVPFLAAWIERESDGRHALESRLGEVGYFQLHPAEIEDIAGAANKVAVITAIKSSPTEAIQWGGRLLHHYDESIVPFGIERGTRLYHGLLKTMHTSRPRGVRWMREVKTELGRNPSTFEEFLATTVNLKARNPSLPRLPTCSAFQLLKRRDAFMLPEDPELGAGSTRGVILASLATGGVVAFQQRAGLLGLGQPEQVLFPGLLFGSPIDGAFVTSGWGRPRPARDGEHEGIDIRAAVGTPVRAVADGVVTAVSRGEHAGLFIKIQHDFGWTSRYMHLSESLVSVGESVSKGEQIALSGQTGVKQSGPHLHFDLLLRTDLLPRYSAIFGTPRGGFGTRRREGTAVPSEPLIPVAGYAPGVIADARHNQIPLFIEPETPFPWGKAVAGVGALAVLLVLGYQYRDPIRDKLVRLF